MKTIAAGHEPKEKEIAAVLERARAAAIDYHRLTGKPLKVCTQSPGR